MSRSRDQELEAIRATYANYGETRAALWDRSNRGFARMVADRDNALISLIKAATSPGQVPRIIDVGCGAAHLPVRAHEAGVSGTWSGVDLLTDEIAEARERAPWGEWLVASADELPFPEDSFDIAVASTLFSSLPSPALSRAVAAEIERVVRPAGRLVWYDLRYDNPWNRAVHGVRCVDLKGLFPGWRVDVRPITLLPPLARRLGLATDWLYPVLNSFTALRSHYVGTMSPEPMRRIDEASEAAIQAYDR